VILIAVFRIAEETKVTSAALRAD